MPRAKVIYNEDGDLLCCLKPNQAIELTHANLAWTLDQIPVDIWEFHTATPDVCNHSTKVGEIIGRRIAKQVKEYAKQNPYEPPGPKPANLHCYTALGMEYLIAEGTDPLQVRTEFLRKHNVKIVGEMRMGDTHHRSADPTNPLVPQFLLDHPEYVIKRPDGIESVALDYRFKEVRSHRLAILRELLEDYNIDGLSLNFMRWGKYFERDWGRVNAPIMTEFISDVRDLLDSVAKKRKTSRLLLGARVLSTTEENLGAGLDTAAWIRRDYLDYVVPCEHNCSWPALNVEQFATVAKGTRCEVYGMMGDMIGGAWDSKPNPENRGLAADPVRSGFSSMLNTQEEARGIAANLYAWGATGIALWNIPNNFNIYGHGGWGQDPQQQKRMLNWILEAIDPQRVQTGQRRYHYVPIYKRDYHGIDRNYKYLESGRSQHGAFKGPTLYFNEGMRGERQTFPFRSADGQKGEKLKGVLKFRMVHCNSTDTFKVDINGVAVPAEKLDRRVSNQDTEFLWTWVILNLAEAPPLRGDNNLGLIWTSQSNHGLEVPFMEELDLVVDP